MRVSVHDQAKDFILTSKKTWIQVFKSEDIKLSVRNYLVAQELFYTPIRGIYILKKQWLSFDESVKLNIYHILESLWNIVTWDLALYYYLGSKKIPKNILLISRTKNYKGLLWEITPINIICRCSTTPRIIHTVTINGANLSIETPLSFIVNHFFQYKNDKKFHELILTQDFEETDILNLLVNKYKISWISRLAIFYKNNGFPGKYSIIKNTLHGFWKKIDRRSNKVLVEIQKQDKYQKKTELEDLLN
jgi:hypothetical protein